MIKRIQKIAVITLLGILLTGCGEKEEEIDLLSQDMMNKIETIGDVTIEDKDLIENLMETYAGMTERQKDQVKNYLTLKNAKDELDVLLQQKAEEDDASLKEENNKKFEQQRKYYTDIQNGISFTKGKMKHPTSFVVKGVILMSEAGYETKPFIYISFESENDLGNSLSSVYVYRNANIETVNEDKNNQYVEFERISNGNGDSTYTKVEDNSFTFTNINNNKVYVFKLDEEDYKAQGYSGLE